MAGSIQSYIAYPGFTLAPLSTANVDIRLSDINEMKIFLNQTWVNTASASGLSVTLFEGWGGKDPKETPVPIPVVISVPPTSANSSTIPQFSTNYNSVTIVNPTLSSSASQTTSTVFYLNEMPIVWSQWVRMQIISLDPTNTCQNIQILASIA